MSNSLAIAAVTATLRKLLEDGVRDVPGAAASTQPPDKVTAANLVNLFLYQTVINAAWSNQDMPRQVKPGETGQPPLALNLYYLLTAYGPSDDSQTVDSHRLLGRAMSVLYDHPVLSADDIKAALPLADLPKFDLYDQIERVRITHQPLTLDELSKLWTTFQVNYRISTAYEVSVVLIDSTRPSRTPLPVLKRGPEDRGVDAQGSLIAPYPTLTELVLPTDKQPSLQLGEDLIIRGHHLDCDSWSARFDNPRLDEPREISGTGPVTTIETTGITVTLLDDTANSLVAGFYTVALVLSRPTELVDKVRTTNELSFSLAPRILPGTLLPQTAPAAAGDFTLTLTCGPQVRPEQRVSLLFGGNEIPADAHATRTDTLTFRIKPVTAALKGEHFVRLRVDGVDSLLVRYAETPPVFDDNQKVTIT